MSITWIVQVHDFGQQNMLHYFICTCGFVPIIILYIIDSAHRAHYEAKCQADVLLNKVKLEIEGKETAKSEAERANALKSQVVAYIFHEQRNALQALLLLADSLESSDLISAETKTTENIYDIGSFCRVISDITTSILTIEKMESGTFQFHKAFFNLRGAVQTSVKIINFQFKKKKILFVVNIDESVSASFEIYGDKNRIRQSIDNLLSNAHKFTPEGGEVTLEVGIVRELNNNVTLHCKVSDSGVGIKPDDKGKLFKPYSQINPGALQNGGGTGLGLCLSKYTVVEGHGGRIGFESECGKTVFNIEIPLAPGEYREVESPPRQYFISLKKKMEKRQEKLKKQMVINASCDILVVEDSLFLQQMYTQIIKCQGYSVESAYDGQSAIDKIKNGEQYRLILMDHQMPGDADGAQATAAIRKLGFEAPIIGITGDALDELFHTFMNAGLTSLLTKPLAKNELENIIEKHLSY